MRSRSLLLSMLFGAAGCTDSYLRTPADFGVRADDGGSQAHDSTTEAGVQDAADDDHARSFDLRPSDDSGSVTDLSALPLSVGLDERPANSSCVAHPRPVPTGGQLTTEPASELSAFDTQLTDLKRGPAPYRGWFGSEQGGRLRWLADGATAAQPVLDMRTDSGIGFTSGGESGLLGLAIDPAYPNADAPTMLRIFVNYTAPCSDAVREGLCTVISRFDLNAAGSGSAASFSASAESILMRVYQPSTNHNGGGMQFGPDGHLYISFGDGGSGNDPWCNAQNLNTPLGKLLRLDVHSRPPAGMPYAIPANNPFAPRPGAPVTTLALCNLHLALGNTRYPSRGIDQSRSTPCPEILAYGLRNPFRFSFDRSTGDVWIGDVGQGAAEEIDLLRAPEQPSPRYGQPEINFGWPLREGTRNAEGINASHACNSLPAAGELIEPVYEYFHADNERRGVVVGGYVYRGNSLGTTFRGAYFFSELGTREFWAMRDPYNQATSLDVDGLDEPQVMHSGYGMAEDDAGELYLLSGRVRRFVLQDPGGTSDFPQTLSATGCVEPGQPSRPIAAMIPYAINAPFWSDGASKTRFLAIPDGTTITRNGHCAGQSAAECAIGGNWELPLGSVVLKQFRRDGRLLETRLLMRHDDGLWGGYTYVWRADQSDADLIEGDTQVPGTDWVAPGRDTCLQCHTQAAGRTLGLESAQLNRRTSYPRTGRSGNQIDTLSAIGMFSDPVTTSAASSLTALVDPYDASAPIEAAARAYLHTNCAQCHRAGGTTGSAMDLRFHLALPGMNICNVDPRDPDHSQQRLLSPGMPNLSAIAQRPKSLEAGVRMPPLASSVVDTTGTTRLDDWIEQLSGCP